MTTEHLFMERKLADEAKGVLRDIALGNAEAFRLYNGESPSESVFTSIVVTTDPIYLQEQMDNFKELTGQEPSCALVRPEDAIAVAGLFGIDLRQ